MDRLLDLGLPGLVFLALCFWLVRKAVRAARTEGDLEGERLTGAFAEELAAAKALAAGKPRLVPPVALPTPTAKPFPLAAPSPSPSAPQSAALQSPGPQSPAPVSPPAIALLAPERIPDLLRGADLGPGVEGHLPLLAQLIAEREASMRALQVGPSDVPLRVEVLRARANRTHLVGCERRHAATRAAAALTRDVICVAAVEKGKISERWNFG